MPEKSKVYLESGVPVHPSGTPVVSAFGDPDDHLRICALLADALGDKHGADPDIAAVCTTASSTWRERKAAIQDLLRGVQGAADRAFAVLIDIDALWPKEGAFESATFSRERRWLFDTILRSIDGGGWIVVRPVPLSSVTDQLDGVDLDYVPSHGNGSTLPGASPGDRERLAQAQVGVSPAVRRVMQGLVDTETRTARQVARLLEGASPSTLTDTLLEVAYGVMTPRTRQAAWKLALLRGPQAVNGGIGPLRVRAGDLRRDEVGQQEIEYLRRAGWICDQGEAGLTMHTAVRDFVERRARYGLGDEMEELHKWLASRSVSEAPLSEQLEVHYHAVAAGLLERSFETAVAYGADLRLLGTRLSKEERYQEAANVFRRIVENFDREDAYSWEYLGYNLALGRSRQQLEVGDRSIRDAYEKAVQLEPGNALFQGRWLGFRAECGEAVLEEVNGLFGRLMESGHTNGLGYAAKPIFDALSRSGRHDELRELARTWDRALPVRDELSQYRDLRDE